LNPIESDTSSHSSRVRVLRLISLIPGIHLRELWRLLGLSFSSTRYHVDKLCTAGKIVREGEKGYVRLFPSGLKQVDKTTFSFLRTKRFRDILTALAEEPHLTNKEICSRTKLAKSTVSKCIHELMEAGLVRNQPSVTEGTITYQICDPEYLLRLLINAHKSAELARNEAWPGLSTDSFENS
jgi:predicted transcriptional regulator